MHFSDSISKWWLCSFWKRLEPCKWKPGPGAADIFARLEPLDKPWGEWEVPAEGPGQCPEDLFRCAYSVNLSKSVSQLVSSITWASVSNGIQKWHMLGGFAAVPADALKHVPAAWRPALANWTRPVRIHICRLLLPSKLPDICASVLHAPGILAQAPTMCC